jgi:hypothetical protein
MMVVAAGAPAVAVADIPFGNRLRRVSLGRAMDMLASRRIRIST